jgi:hypothetical protein
LLLPLLCALLLVPLEFGCGNPVMQEGVFVLLVCVGAISVFCQPASSHLHGFWVPSLHQNPWILVLYSPFEHCVDV